MLGLVNRDAFAKCHMALLGKCDSHARVPYGTLGSERPIEKANDYGLVNRKQTSLVCGTLRKYHNPEVYLSTISF